MLRRYHKKPKEEVEDVKVNLQDLTVKELKEQAKELNLEGYSDLKKAELIELLEGK